VRITGLIEQMLEEEYHLKVAAVQELMAESVGVTPVQVLTRNPNRIMYLLINISPNTVYMLFSGEVSPTKGILLDAGGGRVASWVKEDAVATGEEIWVVADGANSNIYGFEVVAVA